MHPIDQLRMIDAGTQVNTSVPFATDCGVRTSDFKSTDVFKRLNYLDNVEEFDPTQPETKDCSCHTSTKQKDVDVSVSIEQEPIAARKTNEKLRTAILPKGIYILALQNVGLTRSDGRLPVTIPEGYALFKVEGVVE